MRRARLVLIAALILIVASLVPGAALAQGPFADPAFADTWTRTDAPVSNGQTSRTYYWGPCTSTPGGQPEHSSARPAINAWCNTSIKAAWKSTIRRAIALAPGS